MYTVCYIWRTQGFHNNQMGGHLREKQNKRICQIYWLESGHGVLRMWAVLTYDRAFKTVFDWETKWLFTKGHLREWWKGETCHDCIWFLEQWHCYLQEHLYYLITFFCNLQDFIKELWIKYNSRLNIDFFARPKCFCTWKKAVYGITASYCWMCYW